MKDFVDLRGASGAEYRFRIWPEGAAHVPTAGNYVCLREEADGFAVLLVGVTTDLSRARDALASVAQQGATHVFTRLNVARAVRTAEHLDLAAAHEDALIRDDG